MQDLGKGRRYECFGLIIGYWCLVAFQLSDKFGISWQIVPTILGELMRDKDPAKAGRVMGALMKMKKLDIAELKKAHEG